MWWNVKFRWIPMFLIWLTKMYYNTIYWKRILEGKELGRCQGIQSGQTLFFLEQFLFTAKLSAKYKQFPFCSCPPHAQLCPLVDMTGCSGAFVTTNNISLMYHYYPKSICTLWSIHGVHSMDCDKHMITCAYHFNI
jgi:hypothetical protein